MSMVTTNDGVSGRRRRFMRCDACLSEIAVAAVIADTTSGRVDLCGECDSAGYQIEASGQISRQPPAAAEREYAEKT